MFIKLLFCYFIFNYTFGQEELGDECSGGVCTLITSCQDALTAIQTDGFHKLKRCGFIDLTEIVCCPLHLGDRFSQTSPDAPSTTSRKPLRKAEVECQKIVDSVPPPSASYIVGGIDVAIGEFPHMAAIGHSSEEPDEIKFICGGSLISHNYVLTAAHCTFSIRNQLASIKAVRIGVVEIGDVKFNTSTDYTVEEVIVHPEYNSRTKYNDIALLRLGKGVVFSENIHPACLYTSIEDPSQELTVIGWGTTEFGSSSLSEKLLKANLTIVPLKECQEKYKPTRQIPRGITNDQLCARDPKGVRDTCQGDSGGPLQALTERDGHYRIVAVTSFGIGCAVNIPGVYAKVSSYLDWIENIVWPEN